MSWGKLLLGIVAAAGFYYALDKRKKVFVSFDFDNDQQLKHFIIGQSKLKDSPFSIIDHSLEEEKPDDEWEYEAEKRIKSADIVVVMVGPKTHQTPGVKKEVKMANKHKKKIMQIIGYKDSKPKPVPNAGKLYKWEWDQLKKHFRS